MYQKLALAIAFSPRQQALICEAARLCKLFDARLLLIHVGEKTPEKETELNRQLAVAKLAPADIQLLWEEGDPVNRILSLCREEKVDLLLAGALKKENIFRYYIGSVARKFLRKAEIPVLVLIEPQEEARPFKRLVLHAGDKAEAVAAIKAGCYIGRLDQARQLHVIKELKMYGLTMALAGEDPEHEYSETRRNLLQDEINSVQRVISRCSECDGLRLNVKITAGKSGYELAKFARQSKADLLVTEAPAGRLNFFDRMFPHDLEYILADLPCNLLVVQPQNPA
jgi:nucleotide-binding universal stress UspA family protein